MVMVDALECAEESEELSNARCTPRCLDGILHKFQMYTFHLRLIEDLTSSGTSRPLGRRIWNTWKFIPVLERNYHERTQYDDDFLVGVGRIDGSSDGARSAVVPICSRGFRFRCVTRVTDKIRAPPGLAALTVRNFDTCKLQRQPNFTNVNYVHTSPHSQKIEDNRDDGEPKGTIPALQWAAPGQHPGSHSYIFSFAQVLVAVARFSAFSSCIGP